MLPTSSNPATVGRLNQVADGLFFLVGCGRSGTTLLRTILIAHPDVAIPPETKLASKFPAYTPTLASLDTPAKHTRAIDLVIKDQRKKGIPFDTARFRELADAAPRTWEGLLLALLTACADHEGRPRVGEKSPSHTPHVGRLAAAFPHAKFIHLLRDPRATLLSRIRAKFTAGALGAEIPRWREAADMHRNHADRLGPSRYLLLRYEDLVTDLEPTVRTLCDFLGLDPRPEMLTPHLRDEDGFDPRATPWMQNTLKPVFMSSIDMWRTELTPTQIALIEHALRDDMIRMGYQPTGATTSFPGLRLAVSAAAGQAEYTRRKAVRGLRKVFRRTLAPHAEE